MSQNEKMEVEEASEKAAGGGESGRWGTQKNDGANGETLDHNLYSRYTLGESAMMFLRNASVLISGMGGVGVELAKNLILGGVRTVSIHDTRLTTYNDLSSQYYLAEEHIGKNRAHGCFEKLAELNDSVNCSLHTEELTEDIVAGYDLIILTGATRSEQLRIAAWTRAAKRRLLVADARGLFSYVFVDFGDDFRVDDQNGESCREFHIEHVDGETGDVTTLENAFHGLEDGDHVTFSELKGMEELNGIEPVKITVKKAHVFNIGTAAKGFSPCVEGGRAIQVKVPTHVSHLPLVDSLSKPEICMWEKFEYPNQLHALWTALYAFEEKFGRSPRPRSMEDVQTLKAELPEDAEIDDKLLEMFSFSATGNLAPVTSVVGGIAAQEAMKGVTHHMTPLKQWLYIDHTDALPGPYTSLDASKLTAGECAPRQSRYDGQAAVLGWKFQEELGKQRVFVVGAGAIGCELLKNMAMMGVGCAEGGLIKITDMDQIEISNLNRQFLFRKKDVGHLKSEVAARAAKAFNPEMRIEALSERVHGDTEHIFNDDFFETLDCVANALDNVEARRYVDRRCVYYQLPLLESGTMGTKGNVQVVYPHLTESYGSSVDPPEKDIPICTLKNFPNEIQHTIQWARDLYEGLFVEPAETANKFLSNQKAFLERIEQMNTAQAATLLNNVRKALLDDRPATAEDCINWARDLFQEHYHNNIAQMLHTFPPDQVTDLGAKFWSGTKRCPHVLNFDPIQEEQFNLIYSASILRATMYKLEPILDKKKVAEIAAAKEVPPFSPKSGVKIAITDADLQQQDGMAEMDDEEQLQQLKLNLARLLPASTPALQQMDFEKDDDSNHHMEFITAASNLRAENYDIAQADRMKTKQIAGRIIPAIATTTAAIAGLVCVELCKLVLPREERIDKKTAIPINKFKNGFINLSLSFYSFAEPVAAAKKKYADKEFTLWDRLEVKGPKTMKELKEWVEQECGVTVSMISAGVSLIYSFFMDAKKRAARENTELVEELTPGIE